MSSLNHLKEAESKGHFVLFSRFPALAGITTNHHDLFSPWPKMHMSKLIFGDGKTNADDDSDQALAKLLGHDEYLRLAPEHSDWVRLFSHPFDDNIRYVGGDGIVCIEKNDDSGIFSRPALFCVTADCPIVVLYASNDEWRSTAIVHSGWRGTQKNIVLKAVSLMVDKLSCSAVDVYAGLWPGICQSCYEVGSDMEAYFPGRIFDNRLKLSSIIFSQLYDFGLKTERITVLDDYCSKHSQDADSKSLFQSYRRDGGKASRNMVFIS